MLSMEMISSQQIQLNHRKTAFNFKSEAKSTCLDEVSLYSHTYKSLTTDMWKIVCSRNTTETIFLPSYNGVCGIQYQFILHSDWLSLYSEYIQHWSLNKTVTQCGRHYACHCLDRDTFLSQRAPQEAIEEEATPEYGDRST